MTTVCVLGSGIMATALAFPLADNGHEVRLVGTHLDREIIDSIKETRVHPNLDLEVSEVATAFQLEEAEEAFDGADVVMSGVNSFGVRWAGKQLASLLKPGMHVLSIAKGMEATENGDLRILPEVLAGEVPLGSPGTGVLVGHRRALDRRRGRRAARYVCGLRRPRRRRVG